MIIGVIIVLILYITFTLDVDVDPNWGSPGFTECNVAIQLFGLPQYLDPNPKGSAVWNRVGLENIEILVHDESTPVQLCMKLDIFDKIRRNNVLMDDREFYRRLFMIHKVGKGICYDASGQKIWIKSKTIQECLTTAVNVKNMDLKPEPITWEWTKLFNVSNHQLV